MWKKSTKNGKYRYESEKASTTVKGESRYSSQDIFDLIIPRYIQIWQSKEMSHDFVRGQSVAETCFNHWDWSIAYAYTVMFRKY